MRREIQNATEKSLGTKTKLPKTSRPSYPVSNRTRNTPSTSRRTLWHRNRRASELELAVPFSTKGPTLTVKINLKLSKSKHCIIRCLFLAPDPPEGLRAYANSSSELVIEWKPPLNPNGIVTHYIVIGSWQRDDQDWVDKHDSCAERKTIIL